jgi:hypothetical protein
MLSRLAARTFGGPRKETIAFDFALSRFFRGAGSEREALGSGSVGSTEAQVSELSMVNRRPPGERCPVSGFPSGSIGSGWGEPGSYGSEGSEPSGEGCEDLEEQVFGAVGARGRESRRFGTETEVGRFSESGRFCLE